VVFGNQLDKATLSYHRQFTATLCIIWQHTENTLQQAVDFGNQRAKATLLNNSEFTASHCIVLQHTGNTLQQAVDLKISALRLLY